MGFDNLFEHDSNHHRQNSNHHYRNNNDTRSSHSYNQHYNIKQLVLERLRNNPNLKAIVIIIAIILIVTTLVIAILLFPLLMKLFQYFSENGIQGIINTIWKGTK